MAKITSLDLHRGGKQYVSYNDTDFSTDYFHGYTLGVAAAIEWLKRDGADQIRVGGNIENPTYQKRVARIAKATGYRATSYDTVSVYGIRQTGWTLERAGGAA